MKYYAYILQSETDGSYYIGHTDSLDRRLEQHNAGKSKYTARKTPWKLVYFEEFNSRKEANQRERFLKKQRNKSFYERLIENMVR